VHCSILHNPGGEGRGGVEGKFRFCASALILKLDNGILIRHVQFVYYNMLRKQVGTNCNDRIVTM